MLLVDEARAIGACLRRIVDFRLQPALAAEGSRRREAPRV